MNLGIVRKQLRCAALGFFPDGGIDGIDGPGTQAAYRAAMKKHGQLYPSHGLDRIHFHWSGGEDGVTKDDLSHYYVVVDDKGRVFYGPWGPEANANTSDGVYYAHTWRFNTGAIPACMDAMGGAKERPYFDGGDPITTVQFDKFAEECAVLAVQYGIPITKYSMLSHSEIQPTTGIKQRGKWDINILPGMSKPGDPVEVGDMIRDRVRFYAKRYQ